MNNRKWFVAAIVVVVAVLGRLAWGADPTGTNTVSFITQTAALIAIGPKPVLSGTCTSGGQIGGNTAGSFTATCSGQTVILTFAATAPNGWFCVAQDISTTTDFMRQSATSATSCTLLGTTGAADVITFHAVAY